ncbi:MAG: DUF6452 family protein [Bacteroidota bacterium]
MIKKTQYTAILIVLFVWGVFSSCTNQDVCEDTTSIPVRVGFYQTDTESEEPVSYTIDSLSISGINNDSLIYNNAVNVGSVEMPLDPSRDSCGFVIVFPPVEDLDIPLKDTIWFYYERKPNLISTECGFVNFYEIDKLEYTNHRIDTMEIENTSVTNGLDEHIKAFPFIFVSDDVEP